MARFLLGLSNRDLEKYKVQELHIIPRASWSRLSADEQNAARAKGITAKGDDYQTHTGTPIDELPIADRAPDPERVMETSESESHVSSLSADERTWYVVRLMVDMVISAPNARLEAECIRLASGFGAIDNITEASIARKHGLTRQAVSKRCKRIVKLLGIRPSQFMRSMEQCETYRKARVRSLKKSSS